MPKPPRSLRRSSQILRTGDGPLRSIYDETRRLQSIQRRVAKHIHGDVDVASFTEGHLHLMTGSAASATRIRYRQKILISELNQEPDPTVTSIRVSVRPVTLNPLREPRSQTENGPDRGGDYVNVKDDDQTNRSRERPARELSRQSADHLAETAKYVQDKDLRDALIRLSKRGKSD